MKFLIFLIAIPVMSQAQSANGTYFLRGVHETAAGFNLQPDSTFEFFYSEGALDRYAKGHWRVDGQKVIFNTAKPPSADFLVKSKSIRSAPEFIVRIVEPNTALKQFVFVTAFSKGVASNRQTNREGLAIFNLKTVDSMKLVFQFCPERATTIKINGRENYYELGFQPWLFELFFINLEFKLEGDTLLGPNPFNGLPGRYIKQSNQ